MEGSAVLTRRRLPAACALLALAAACGGSGPAPEGPPVAWQGGTVQAWDHGVRNVRAAYRVEWTGPGGAKRILCETARHQPGLAIDGEGRLVVSWEEPVVEGTRFVTCTFASPDGRPEKKKVLR
jgi:hypothetical protein